MAQTFENQVYFWGIREIEEEAKSLINVNLDEPETPEVIKIGKVNN